MNKRQRRKVTISLIAKVVAKVKYPELMLSLTRQEMAMYRKMNRDYFVRLVKETLENAQHI